MYDLAIYNHTHNLGYVNNFKQFSGSSVSSISWACSRVEICGLNLPSVSSVLVHFLYDYIHLSYNI